MYCCKYNLIVVAKALMHFVCIYVTVYGKTGHNAACVISRKDRSISKKCIVSS